MAEDIATPPADRYGRPRWSPKRPGRLALVLTLLVAALGVLIATLGYQRLGDGEVSGKLAGFDLIDDHTVEVIITVTRKDPTRPVVCILRARSHDGSETGRREILVGPAQDVTIQTKALVKTSHPPVTGDVYGCGTDIPSYLVAPG